MSSQKCRANYGANGKSNIKQELRSNRTHGRTIRLCTKINPSRIISQGSSSVNNTARGKRGNIMTNKETEIQQMLMKLLRKTQRDLDEDVWAIIDRIEKQ